VWCPIGRAKPQAAPLTAFCLLPSACCFVVLNRELKDLVVTRLLPYVQTPGQYVGGEVNTVVKDHAKVRARLCLAFPDAYSVGMSWHGLQVLYHLMNRRADWACERVFAPWSDMEGLLRQHRVPLYSLETFTPLPCFDVLAFTLQHELAYTNALTILDLAGLPLMASERTLEHPLVIAGGPCACNPEPMSRFVDLFAIGDGEETLPAVCDAWLNGRQSGRDRASILAAMAAQIPSVYVPQCYESGGDAARRAGAARPKSAGLPAVIPPAVIADLDAVPLPTSPIVPYVATVQDRITIEIMRGCPWRCRFCQSRALKWPVRCRRVETIVEGALESYRNTGYEEVSLLSLSTSDYPHFDELMRRMQQTFRPLGVGISVPSLRINEQLRTISDLLGTERHSGLTLAPEAARDELRRQVGKAIRNDDLYEGCRRAFQNGFHRVKLYFMCGLPGEGPADLDAMIDMAEAIAGLGREIRGRPVTVVVNVSNFVPKPHTSFERLAIERREYFHEAHRHLRRRKVLRSVQIKCHDVEASLLEAALARGDRRAAAAIELAWRRGARFDSWHDRFRPELWWPALAEAGIDVDELLHQPYAQGAPLPWSHIGFRVQGSGARGQGQ
jgi:radical SAM family uncharacterized protein